MQKKVLNPFKPSSEALEVENNLGAQGILDEDALEESAKVKPLGAVDTSNHEESEILIEHMLKPFKYRKNYLISCYDAAKNLESYLTVLFPTGTGGPSSVGVLF